jgi:hypothetical protein
MAPIVLEDRGTTGGLISLGLLSDTSKIEARPKLLSKKRGRKRRDKGMRVITRL